VDLVVGSRKRRVQFRTHAVDPRGAHADATCALHVIMLRVTNVKAHIRGKIQLCQYETEALRLRLVAAGAL
jgi:hypothetical protein